MKDACLDHPSSGLLREEVERERALRIHVAQADLRISDGLSRIRFDVGVEMDLDGR